MSTVAKKQANGGLGGVADLIAAGTGLANLFVDRETKTTQTTSPSTTTKGLDITQEGVDALIKDILASSQGLAATASGQKTAGLYNTTVNQQLLNDLNTRAAGEVAKATAKEVTTTSGGTVTGNSVQEAAIDPMTGLAVLGGAMVGKKLLENTDIFGSIFGGGGDLAPSASYGGIIGMPGLDSGGIFGGFPALSFGSKLLSGEPEDALATGAGFLIGNALLPGVGGPIGSLLTDIIPVGDIFSDIGSSIGDIFGGSVVCTHLHSVGLMSKYHYTIDVMYAKKYMSEDTLNGYRYWGIPLVKLMRKYPKLNKLVAWFAVARAHYVTSLLDDGFYSDKLARRGKVINAIGVPMCNLIAKFTKPKDWSVLYATERKVG